MPSGLGDVQDQHLANNVVLHHGKSLPSSMPSSQVLFTRSFIECFFRTCYNVVLNY